MRCLRAISSGLLVFLIVESLCSAVSGIRWLSMAMSGSASSLHDVSSCGKQRGLVKRQRQLCRRHFDLMQAVQSGAFLAIVECQNQFSNRRWNCSTINAASVFGNVLNQGTRESAFVHAISAAGVSHAVTRSCSSGQVDRCGCDRTVWGKSRKGDFEWAGCSDNIAYGNAFSKTFVDARERTRGSNADRALMNLHNNNAGRQRVYLRDDGRSQSTGDNESQLPTGLTGCGCDHLSSPACDGKFDNIPQTAFTVGFH
ncbi:Protein Wnt-4 [Lamellibrachia satsuma]|nr:Protein Wnt-4 [Lamellibrachia satsuma]